MLEKKIIAKLNAAQNQNYAIWLKSGLIKKTTWLPRDLHTIIIITDTNIKRLYADGLAKILKSQKYNVSVISFSSGENSKSFSTYYKIVNKLHRAKAGRDALLLAVGGGVVGDMTGFVAATYMRGIAYMQLPTSLLAMIDSSVGGKTGINMPGGKNFIGAFYPPKAVIADIASLNTLSQTQFINGLFELIKILLISDKTNWEYFKRHYTKVLERDKNVLFKLITTAIILKTKIVNSDFQEKNQRMILNFGHTIGHALEKSTNYKILHGYAVGYGMLLEAKISLKKALLSPMDYSIIQQILSKLGITPKKLGKFDINKIIAYTHMDKKNRKNKVQYVLLAGIGKTYTQQNKYTHYVEDQVVKAAFEALIGE